MGQADAFETDFWKHANLRKVWEDDIVSGRATQDHSLHADTGSDCAVLQGGWRRSPDLFR